MTAQTQKQLPLEALSDVVKAWESLQGQSYHSVKAVQDWLSGPMVKAINNAREVLKTTNAPVAAPQSIEALEAELAACKRDAERYRWLRHEEGDIGNLYIGIDSPAYKNQWALSGEKADAAIDAAMAAQEQK